MFIFYSAFFKNPRSLHKIIQTTVIVMLLMMMMLAFSLCRILVSTIPAVLCYFLIWVVPPIEQGKIMWYLLFYCLFQTLQTVSTFSTLYTFIVLEELNVM